MFDYEQCPQCGSQWPGDSGHTCFKCGYAPPTPAAASAYIPVVNLKADEIVVPDIEPDDTWIPLSEAPHRVGTRVLASKGKGMGTVELIFGYVTTTYVMQEGMDVTSTSSVEAYWFQKLLSGYKPIVGASARSERRFTCTLLPKRNWF